MVLPDLTEHEAALGAIVDDEHGDLVPMLQAVQRRFGWLPRNALEFIAARAGVPLARLWSVATFYASFHLQPRGRTVVRVCHGTACHVRGARRISDALAVHLELPADGGTTGDLRYTLDGVACLGCCSLAPVVAVGEDVLGKLDQRSAVDAVARRTREEDE
ncbi:MAG TPA: NAD(P)H-dependent oxidoreductase subunit E [Kofleriaceae bacterium]|jgi:NADH:ubiquinone oxidoreductase subunit E|nr:NAD(P)H-dependent oxidoreductase subunit E [Kofleriaceae bacterium]